jgi:uncharacterized protein YjbK
MSNSTLLSMLTCISTTDLYNGDVCNAIRSAKVSLRLSIEQPEKASYWNKKFQLHMDEALQEIKKANTPSNVIQMSNYR